MYFLEVNTRVQVEHPVTEEVTGVDIIREMFKIAEGEKLTLEPPVIRRHSIEFRINAEDPWSDFCPIPGKIRILQLPSGPGVRVDFGYAQNDTIPPYYDSLIGKIIVSGSNRAEAISRARRALAEFKAVGIKTIVPLHRAILEQPQFAADSKEEFKVYTRWIDSELAFLSDAAKKLLDNSIKSGPEDSIGQSAASVEPADELPTYRAGVKAPLSGMIMEICVSEGDMIGVGDVVAIMESMKMEQTITSDISGVVCKVNVEKGAFIEMDADIVGVD
ncbi:Biotin carboxylase [compost metagenome]